MLNKTQVGDQDKNLRVTVKDLMVVMEGKTLSIENRKKEFKKPPLKNIT